MRCAVSSPCSLCISFSASATSFHLIFVCGVCSTCSARSGEGLPPLETLLPRPRGGVLCSALGSSRDGRVGERSSDCAGDIATACRCFHFSSRRCELGVAALAPDDGESAEGSLVVLGVRGSIAAPVLTCRGCQSCPFLIQQV